MPESHVAGCNRRPTGYESGDGIYCSKHECNRYNARDDTVTTASCLSGNLTTDWKKGGLDEENSTGPHGLHSLATVPRFYTGVDNSCLFYQKGS